MIAVWWTITPDAGRLIETGLRARFFVSGTAQRGDCSSAYQTRRMAIVYAAPSLTDTLAQQLLVTL